jgi:NDP-sugar pyrophosphorylase family protein
MSPLDEVLSFFSKLVWSISFCNSNYINTLILFITPGIFYLWGQIIPHPRKSRFEG